MPNEVLHPTGLPLSGKNLEGLQTRDRKPPGSSSGVDQLRGGETRTRTQIGEMTFHGAGSNTHELGGVRDGSASGDVGSEDVHLARSRWPRERAAQVPVSHANRGDPLPRDPIGCNRASNTCRARSTP